MQRIILSTACIAATHSKQQTFTKLKTDNSLNMRKTAFIILLLCAAGCLETAAQRTNTQKPRKEITTHVTDSLIRDMEQKLLIDNASVDYVSEERMNKGLVTSSLSALSGQAAGVQVTADSRMAALSSVRVRGTTSLTGGNDPLVIIDGVSSSLSTLSSIYPADIESFTILKNAAETALYGSRGASGVIQVTTKKGKSGHFHISYDGDIGFQSVYKNINMLNRQQYLGEALARGFYANDGGQDTDFPDALTRTGVVNNHHLAFSGGNEESSYRASIGVMKHNTVIRNNSYNNFVAKIDLTQKAFDGLLKIDLGLFGSSQRNKNIFDEFALFYSAAAQNPTFHNGMYNGAWERNTDASQISNPIALLQEKDHENNLNFNTHAQLHFQFTKDLWLEVFGSYSYTSNENRRFLPTWVWAQGQAYRGELKGEDWLVNAIMRYQHKWGAHDFAVVGFGEYQENQRSGFYTTVKGFTSNYFGYDNLDGGSILPDNGTGSSYYRPKLLSFMGSIDYTLLDRYTLHLNARTDGSSMVSKDNRWGFFPSVSGEWNMMKESWMRYQKTFTRLSLRMGYGLSGNLGAIESYSSLRMMRPIGIVPYNGTTSVVMGYPKNVNEDLKWETKSTFNVGVGLGFWNNRFLLNAEYYYSRTRDMIYNYGVSIPPFPYDQLLANLGSMSNSGVEIGMSIAPIETKDWQMSVNVNMSFQRNKLISLSGWYKGEYLQADDMSGLAHLDGAGFHGVNNDITYQMVGQPLGVFFLQHCTGLKDNGDGTYSYEIADLDGDGKVTDGSDKQLCGQAQPKMTLGSNISLRYKQWDLSVQMNGAFGHKIYNGTALTYMNMASFPVYNVMDGAPEKNITDQTITDYWLESGDYLNIDYVTVGWNVPIKSRFISSLRLSCSVNNLATITGYSGLTPMINSYVAGSTMGIDDKRSYPPYRSYSLGVSIQF